MWQSCAFNVAIAFQGQLLRFKRQLSHWSRWQLSADKPRAREGCENKYVNSLIRVVALCRRGYAMFRGVVLT